MRPLIASLLAWLLLCPCARAADSDVPARAPARWHLALEAGLFSYGVTGGSSLGNGRGGSDRVTTQLGAADTVGLRAGYVWPRGWELGVLGELGYVGQTAAPDDRARILRLTPSAYLRYPFRIRRTPVFLGALLGGAISHATSRSWVREAQDLEPTQTLTRSGWSAGIEGGLHMVASDWFSLDPFARWQFSSLQARYSGDYEGDVREQDWRVVVGLAASFWVGRTRI